MTRLNRDEVNALFRALDGQPLLSIYAPYFDDVSQKADDYQEGASINYDEVCLIFKKGTISLSAGDWDDIVVSTGELRKANYPTHTLHPSLQHLIGRELSWVWLSERDNDRFFDLITLSFDNIDPTIAFYAKASSLESFSLEPTLEIKGELFNKVAQFIEDQTRYPASRVRSNTHLKHNLGLDGDTAWRFIQSFNTEFQVAPNKFEYRYYFKPKTGDSLSAFLWKLRHFLKNRWWIQGTDQITVQSLVSAAEFGKW